MISETTIASFNYCNNFTTLEYDYVTATCLTELLKIMNENGKPETMFINMAFFCILK